MSPLYFKGLWIIFHTHTDENKFYILGLRIFHGF